MKSKIEEILPKHVIITTNSSDLYIVDYKDINGGEVELSDVEPNFKYVYLENSQPISVCFDGFPENALPLDVGFSNSQCECVLFPDACNDNDWVLFIETKYANDRKAAFRENRDYPNCMIKQIIESVKYFRNKGIIEEKRRVTAIVSFPNLVEEFSSTFFSGEISMDDILFNHRILVRATNLGTIKSEKRIYI